MRRVDGAKVTGLTPGDLTTCPRGRVAPGGAARGGQKSAEAIRAAAHGGEGPNMDDRQGANASTAGGDADRMAEMPEASRRVAGGTRESRVRQRQTVAAAAEQVRLAMGRRGVELRLEPGPAVTVRADEDLLLQLLLNLLDNARKYTRSGGRVTVGWGVRNGQAEVRVRDTGVGIAPEHLPRIFERFYRVDKARSRAGGGAGLGLSICRWIAEAHGGSISVESVPGAGTAVVVKLPVDAAAAAS